MSLQGIFDPVVRAYFKNKYGGSDGGADHTIEDALLSGTATGDYYNDRVTNLNHYALAYTGFEVVTFPHVKKVGDYCFSNSTKLKKVFLSGLPVGATGTAMAFNSASVEFVDLGKASAGWNAFSKCSSLKTIVLRATAAVSPLSTLTTLSGTPFAEGGTGGKVYVPAALIESYKTATNWSVLYGYGTCEFVALEGSEYE